MSEFFAELKRRHIYRVGAAYVVVAWALTQVVEILAQVFTLPLWMAQTAIVLLAVGFPVALISAWMIESKPHQAVAAAVRTKPSIIDGALCGALGLVILLIAYQQLAPSAPPAQQAALTAAKSASPAPARAVSLAVLPFTNLSSDPEQEFFSDGMTEEITSALARVPDLRVVGRTSAFQFKGRNQDLRAIGQALSATHLIEGSVRKDGNEVRITAQLIRADDGTHLWTESYNRELTGVFAMQEEIATAIASALRVPLGLNTGQSLVANRTADTESYQDYLRAKALMRVRGPLEPGGPLTEAAKLLEQVVARDPNYAPAWGLLGQIYALAPNFTVGFVNGLADEFRRIAAETQKAEAAAQQAIRLDPGNVDGHTALAYARTWRGDFVRQRSRTSRRSRSIPATPTLSSSIANSSPASGV
jgi:TolB-like protein